MTEKEVYDGLRLSGVYRTTGKRAVVETAILGVFCLFFLVSYVLQKETFTQQEKRKSKYHFLQMI